MMFYREIKPEEMELSIFSSFERRQVVTDCVRREGNAWVVKAAPFIDQWSKEDYQFLVECLRGTLKKGGMVFGAFLDGALKGFASVEAEPMGSRGQYRDLTCIHVSEELRGSGAGKALFSMACQWAKAHGGERLYISSHSAVETQAFYRAMGCVDAEEIMEEHARREPFDRQLEKRL